MTDARAKIITRADKGFERTAIVIDAENPASIDVVDSRGAFLCRVNLYRYGATSQPRLGCIDVIVQTGQHVKVTNWYEGVLHHRFSTEGGVVCTEFEEVVHGDPSVLPSGPSNPDGSVDKGTECDRD
jgi:hypothetical protein